MATIAQLRKAVGETRRDESEEITRQLLAQGLEPMDILEDGVMQGLNDVGERFAALVEAALPKLAAAPAKS